MSSDQERQPNRDILQRFPEIGLIEDKEVRDETGYLLQTQAKPWFWYAPAASSFKYHNQFCCGKHGLWIHTKMVSTAFERLVDTYTGLGDITEYESDLGRAAVLLHDLRKYGTEYEEGDSAEQDHDIRAAKMIRRNSELPGDVADAVESHMGPWYEGPDPETPLQRLVHSADMAASTKNGTFGVYQPHETIRKFYPAIPRAEL